MKIITGSALIINTRQSNIHIYVKIKRVKILHSHKIVFIIIKYSQNSFRYEKIYDYNLLCHKMQMKVKRSVYHSKTIIVSLQID